MAPPRPSILRVLVFVDCQNLRSKCERLFGYPWVHPVRLAEALIQEDLDKEGDTSRLLCGVRYYTSIHDLGREPKRHQQMARRLHAYSEDGAQMLVHHLSYGYRGPRQKGVDVRLALDLVRLGTKGLYDVAIVVSEDSDLDPAVEDVYGLRDEERWIAVENALPWAPYSKPRWLPSVKRHRQITEEMFEKVKAPNEYPSSSAVNEWHDFVSTPRFPYRPQAGVRLRPGRRRREAPRPGRRR